MKKHYRLIRRNLAGLFGDSFKVACGADVPWTLATTSDVSHVDCKRCLRKIKAMIEGEG